MVRLKRTENVAKDFVKRINNELWYECASKIACQRFRITREQLESKSRLPKLVTARSFVMRFMYKVAGASQTFIGGCMKRDHATVIHNLKKLSGEFDVYPSIKKRYDKFAIKCNEEYGRKHPKVARRLEEIEAECYKVIEEIHNETNVDA